MTFPPPPPTPLDAQAITQALGSSAARFAIRCVEQCDSTNSLIVQSPPATDGRVSVLLAERQLAGRGRRGRTWQSWPGSSLTLSVLWRYPVGTPVPAGLSLVTGLAVAETLEQLGVIGVQLKWPNDVLVLGQKLCGILIELQSSRGQPPVAVIGIGLNLALPPDADIPSRIGVSDLASHLSNPPDRNRLAALLLDTLARYLDRHAEAGFAALRSAWQQRNAFADLPVCIESEDTCLRGRCAGIDDDGALLLDTATGLQRVLVGDVSLAAEPMP